MRGEGGRAVVGAPKVRGEEPREEILVEDLDVLLLQTTPTHAHVCLSCACVCL